MRRGKRPFWLLAISLLSLVFLIYLIVSLSPNYQFSTLNFQLPILPVFLLTVFLSLFFSFSYIFINFRRGFVVGLFTVTYLLLRLFDLTHIFFLIILTILFLTLELFFSYKK
ncbi:MAG: hypothetical protein HYT08_02675 [Candidatus Levybacteria bacterium]|nr:hypothetical protein [Candidatus Levybacteria bacterium]